MCNEQLENLIDAALADGELTEKEKPILFKKAQAMGVDLDEFEMVLDARLYKISQQKLPRRWETKPNTYNMKVKNCFTALLMALCFTAKAQNNIAVLDFKAGVALSQSDVDGICAIFCTYFTPEGYSLIERGQVSQAIKEQKFQQGSYTGTQVTEIGRILGVSYVVIGDVNYAVGEYNMDVRVMHVESGTVIAKAGITWKKGVSYRKRMRKMARKLARQMPTSLQETIVYVPKEEKVADTPKEEKVKVPKERKEVPLYRPSEPSLRFSTGSPIIASVAFNYQLTSSFMIGCGIGVGGIKTKYENHYNVRYDVYGDEGIKSITLGYPVYIETELRTPMYKWSFFLNAKLGYNIHNISNVYHKDYHDGWYFYDGIGYQNTYDTLAQYLLLRSGNYRHSI